MEEKTLDARQLKCIIDSCENIRDKLLISLMWESCCRVSECINLEHENIKVAEGTIQMENFKTANQGEIRNYRNINMTEGLKSLYEDYCNQLKSGATYPSYVFYETTKQNNKRRMNAYDVNLLFKRIGAKTGIVLRPRDIGRIRIEALYKVTSKL
ncbi:MAG: tyrosine-type recombinase/integrase [Peptostreptococcaceae bacterium]|nr:tyrosine-type recombinase/integrase [Peptostreptococcaceae bacterium]